jgi:flagellar motor protein MotB
MRRAARDKSGDAEGSEGYFASVSDLMVGVLFVFLLMLTVFALNYRDAETAQTTERAKYEQAARDLAAQQAIALAAQAESRTEAAENGQLRTLLGRTAERIQADAEDRAAARLALLTRLQRDLRERQIEVAVDPEPGVLRLSGDALFETGSAALGAKARPVVRTLAEALARILTDGGAAALETVLVEGHTDRQRFQGLDAAESQDRNDRLSADRALAVFLELRRDQPVLDMLRNAAGQPLLGVSGYGERRPRADLVCGADGNCPGNRRIDLRFVISARTPADVRRMLDDVAAALAKRP